MDYGRPTGEAGTRLAQRYAGTRYQVYFDHAPDEKARKAQGKPTVFFDDLSQATRLSFPDIAILDSTSGEVFLLAEIEEGHSVPKNVLGDALYPLFGTAAKVGGRVFPLAGDVVLILGLVTHGTSGTDGRARRLIERINALGAAAPDRTLRVDLITYSDPEEMARRTEERIRALLDARR